MTQLALVIPQSGLPNATEDVHVASDLTAIQTVVNGGLDTGNLSPSAGILGSQLAAAAGITGGQLANGTVTATQLAPGAVTAGGHTNIATSETRTNAAFGTLTTPDQVTGLVLPANGLIVVQYQATWQESVSGGAAAELFLGATAVVSAITGGAPTAQPAAIGGANPGKNVPLTTAGGFGLMSNNAAATQYSGDVTTGQIIGLATAPSVNGVGAPCYIFAAAGTYTISVQFKASSGSVTASNRKLWVQVLSFT